MESLTARLTFPSDPQSRFYASVEGNETGFFTFAHFCAQFRLKNQLLRVQGKFHSIRVTNWQAEEGRGCLCKEQTKLKKHSHLPAEDLDPVVFRSAPLLGHSELLLIFGVLLVQSLQLQRRRAIPS